MENTITIFPAVIFTVILFSSPCALRAFPTNFEDSLDSGDGVLNNIGVVPETRLGRLPPSEGASTFAEAASPSSPNATAEGYRPNSNAIDQISQIFGIPFSNDSAVNDDMRKEESSRKDGTPKYMLDLYKRVANASNGETFGETPYDATTIRSLLVEKGSRSNRDILHFKVDSIPPTERLLRAELHLFRLISKLKGTSGRPKYYQVGIYQRTEMKKTKLIDQRLVLSRGTGREVFNVDSMVHEWLTNSATNYGVYLNVTLISGEPAPTGALRFSLKNVERKPTLLIFTREEIIKDDSLENFAKTEGSLPKFLDYSVPVAAPDTVSSPTSEEVTRSTRNRREIKATHVATEDLCRVESMHVDFERLGWSHRILAPLGFFANKCTGACPFPANADTPYSTHALVQSFMAIESPNTIQTACCVPHELGHVAILYFDESGNIILRQVRNAVAVKCGCH